MSYPIMYTGSIVRIHPCEKLAGHRARTAFLAAFTIGGHPLSLPRCAGTFREECSLTLIHS